MIGDPTNNRREEFRKRQATITPRFEIIRRPTMLDEVAREPEAINGRIVA